MKKTPRVERIIERAERIAQSYGDDFIGTEHLLLSIIRDRAGIARGALEDLGSPPAGRGKAPISPRIA